MEGSINQELVQIIKNGFVLLPERRMYQLPGLPEEYKAWVVRMDGRTGVAIPYSGTEEIYNSFAEAEIESCYIGNEHVLYLYVCDVDNTKLLKSMAFASLCENFIAPGEQGENRKLVASFTEEWCARWKDLLGNASREVPVYSILGELMVWQWLLEQGEKPEWTGNQKTRLDFVSANGAWEVKSTRSHADLQITIHGHNQLITPHGCPASLMLCRLEPNPAGKTVNDMVSALVALGIDEDYLENTLTGLGLKKGAFGRKQPFLLTEMRCYPVNEKFPSLSLDHFKDGRLPDGVIKINYVIDLANLEYDVINHIP